eukprot:gene13974-biopygen12228
MIRAWISRTAEQAQAELETLDESEFDGQDVVLKLHYSCLNYKDALALTHTAPIARKYPMVHGIDAVGEDHPVKPEDGPVLVTGVSGGVGTVACLLLHHLGYEVVGLTGSIDAMGEPVSESAAKHFERLQLGSTHLIHRESMSRQGKPLQKEQFAAVVDSVGSHTL